MRPIRMTRFFMGCLRGLNSAEPPADEHHRQGQRPGPAPNACEGNPKARSGAASPQGFTVRCFWVAARDWPCRVHRQTKGGFVRSGPADPRKGQTRQPQPFRQDLLQPRRPQQRALPSSAPAPCRSETGGVTRGRAQPLPVQRYALRQGSQGKRASWRPQAGKASLPLARGPQRQGLARPCATR